MCNFAAANDTATTKTGHCLCANFFIFRCFKQDERNYKDHSIG